MSLIKVVDMNVESECLQEAYAAEAKNKLLFETVYIVPTVKIVCHLAVFLAVLVEISVEQKDRNWMAVRTCVDVEPRSDPDEAFGDFESDHCVQRFAVMRRIPPIGLFDLSAVRIDRSVESNRRDLPVSRRWMGSPDRRMIAQYLRQVRRDLRRRCASRPAQQSPSRSRQCGFGQESDRAAPLI